MKRNYLYILLMVMMGTFVLSSCNDDPEWEEDKKEETEIEKAIEEKYVDLTRDQWATSRQLLELNYSFTDKLYAQRRSQEPNLIYSPLMIQKSLWMWMEFGDEFSKNIIYNSFNFIHRPLGKGIYIDSERFDEYLTIVHNFVEEKGGEISLNSKAGVWFNEIVNINADKTSFWNSKYGVVNFGNSLMSSLDSKEKEKLLNDWVFLNSDQHLSKIAIPEVETTDMVWADLMQINGKFTYSFNQKKTYKEKFTCADGSVCEVDMMHGTLPIRVNRIDLSEKPINPDDGLIMEIPLGSDSRYELYIFLPPIDSSIEWELAKRSWIQRVPCSSCIVNLALPKIHIHNNGSKRSIPSVIDAFGLGNLLPNGTQTVPFVEVGRDIQQFGYQQGCSLDLTDEKGIKGETGKNIEWYDEEKTPVIDVKINRPFIFSVCMLDKRGMLLTGVVGDVREK